MVIRLTTSFILARNSSRASYQKVYHLWKWTRRTVRLEKLPARRDKARARLSSSRAFSAAAACAASRSARCAAPSDQGLTLVHYSAQRKQILWDALGA